MGFQEGMIGREGFRGDEKVFWESKLCGSVVRGVRTVSRL